MDKEHRRAQILAKAREVFAKRGYHAAKIDDIVAAANVARGTFYLYFEDKRAIFEELVDRFFARFHLAIQRIDPLESNRSVADQVRDNISRIVTLFITDRAMTKILLTDAAGLDPAFDRKLRAVYEEAFELSARSLEEGQQIGLVAPGDTRAITYMLVGALKELLYQCAMREASELDVPHLTEQIFSFLSAGFLRIPQQFAKKTPSARPAPTRKKVTSRPRKASR